MSAPKINDDDSVTFTLKDGTDVIAEVDDDGLFLFVPCDSQADYKPNVAFQDDGPRSGWFTVTWKYQPVHQQPIKKRKPV